MKNIIKYLIISIFLTNAIFANEVAVVDTNVLLVKKYAKNNSKKLSFYKMNDLITIINEVKDEDGLLWYKTKIGFVKAQYVIKESRLPIFLEKDMVNTNKNAIQLIVFNLNAKKALIRLKKILKNENNIFVQRTKKAQVVYLVNFKSYKLAKQKQQEISKYYKTSFITKIRNLNIKTNLIKKPIKYISKNSKIESINLEKIKSLKKEDAEFNYIDRNIEDEVGTIDVDKQMAEFDDDNVNVDEKKIEFKNNEKAIYTVNKVKTLNFANNNIKKEIDIKKSKEIEEVKVTKIVKTIEKEKVNKIVEIKQVKIKEIIKKETQVEDNFYVNNTQTPKEYKTTSRFNLRVFDQSKKKKIEKPKTFNNNYFGNEVKKVNVVVVEKPKPKMIEKIKEEVVVKEIIPIKKIEVIKPNLTDKIESLLLGL